MTSALRWAAMRLYTYRYTITTRMTSALRWAEMRAILMFQKEVMGKDSVHKPQPFRRERRAEAVSNRGPSAYKPNALPLGQTGLHEVVVRVPLLCVTAKQPLTHPSASVWLNDKSSTKPHCFVVQTSKLLCVHFYCSQKSDILQCLALV